MKVVFANLNGDKKALRLGFSLWYFLLGPIYLFFKNKIVTPILLTILYVFAIWKGAGVLLFEALKNNGVVEKYIEFLNFPNKYYLYSLITIAVIHVLFTLITPRIVAKKILMKGYIPFSELDTQKLIKYRLAKVGCKSLLSAFTPVEGVPGKIIVNNEQDYEQHIEQLTSLLRSGLITKDEYNERRAAIVMEAK